MLKPNSGWSTLRFYGGRSGCYRFRGAWIPGCWDRVLRDEWCTCERFRISRALTLTQRTELDAGMKRRRWAKLDRRPRSVSVAVDGVPRAVYFAVLDADRDRFGAPFERETYLGFRLRSFPSEVALCLWAEEQHQAGSIVVWLRRNPGD